MTGSILWLDGYVIFDAVSSAFDSMDFITAKYSFCHSSSLSYQDNLCKELQKHKLVIKHLLIGNEKEENKQKLTRLWHQWN
jgi:hypothetical protein